MSNYFILVGDENTWNAAVEKNVWGFSEKTKGYWNKSQIGDLLAFYVTSPTKKVIGFGKIKNKFTSFEQYWPDEIKFQRVLWPHRLEFQVIFLTKNWEDGITVPNSIMLNQGRKKIKQEEFVDLVKSMEKKIGIKLIHQIITN